MKFVLKSGKITLTFPITPKELSVDLDTKVITYDHAMMGERQLPRSSKPIMFTFSGALPSAKTSIPTVSKRKTDSLIKRIRKWQETDRKKIKFIVTGTPWNIDVFINDFQVDYKGNMITYSITLMEYKTMTVRKTKAKAKPKKKPKPAPKRPVKKKKAKTRWYTIKRGDNLWNISRRYTGKGIRWKEMWGINKSRSRSKNPNLIYPKERFKIPPKW